jgi:ATP-dependent helicase/nuclease subunit A
MTVHGAKGLQAPVVLLPDTTQAPRAQIGLLWPRHGDGLPIWPVRSDYDGDFVAAARDEGRRLQDEEYRRLLYVAMTRAQDRLYVCGWRGRRASKAVSWYDLVTRGLERLAESGSAVEPLPGGFGPEFDLARPTEGPGRRIRLGARPEAAGEAPGALGRHAPTAPESAVLPPWAEQPAPEEPKPPAPLQPSRPSSPEPALISPLVHRLLQYLPEIPEHLRRPAARRFLGPLFVGADASQIDALVEETEAVLGDPLLAEVFGPGSRAEVPVVGLIDGHDGPQVVSGQVDRLVVTDDAVLVIDYKTNRPPPASESGVAAVYMRQMASYRGVLQRIYPQRRIEGPRLDAGGGCYLHCAGMKTR